MCDTCGCAGTSDSQKMGPTKKKVVEVHKSLLEANNVQAESNREHFEALGAVCVNLISGPGSGKTTLLEATIERLGSRFSIGVIEGDIETERDADRIRAKDVPAVQLTTGGACHLDAPLVHQGLHRLEKDLETKGLDFIFIENVGNLVCPSTFYLGEHKRVVLVSVPEGSDKPAKYPNTFLSSDLFLITKKDLLPFFDFSTEEAEKEAKRIKPDLKVIALSSVTGEGFDRWIEYLMEVRSALFPQHESL